MKDAYTYGWMKKKAMTWCVYRSMADSMYTDMTLLPSLHFICKGQVIPILALLIFFPLCIRDEDNRTLARIYFGAIWERSDRVKKSVLAHIRWISLRYSRRDLGSTMTSNHILVLLSSTLADIHFSPPPSVYIIFFCCLNAIVQNDAFMTKD